MLHDLIGDRAFYKRVLAVALPIIIQNAVTNFVSLLDNIMVGQLGTVQMSGVSIVNQLMFVFNIFIFGVTSGAGIFTAQFHGSKDHDGVRQTLRFKVLSAMLITLLGLVVFLTADTPLINLYLRGEGDPADAALSLEYGRQYLQVMLLGLLPFALTNAYSSTLRETGQTLIPMIASTTAVFVNLVFNYILIFGHFGAPVMGVRGAALATALSRYVELGIVIGWTHLHPARNPFIRGVYRSLHISGKLLKQILIKGTPLMLNEAMWAIGMALVSQCYSLRGLDVVAANNITSTISHMGSVVYLSMGNVVGIIMGQMMGGNLPREEIKRSQLQLTALSVGSCLIFGLAQAGCSGLFPMIYKTSDSVRTLATAMICINAAFMPFNAYAHATYFTLRSGGKTVITFLFDSGFVWGMSVPIAFCLSRFTSLPILPLYALCLSVDLIKCVVAYFMLRKGTWIQNLAKK